MSRSSIPAQITKLLPVLASDQDGEVLATARAIGRTLRSNGLDFHDLVDALAVPDLGTKKNEARRPDRSWQSPHAHGSPDFERVRRAWEQGACWLPAKDVEFLQSLGFRLCRWGGKPSQAQAKWLTDICARVEARAAA